MIKQLLAATVLTTALVASPLATTQVFAAPKSPKTPVSMTKNGKWWKPDEGKVECKATNKEKGCSAAVIWRW